MRNALPWLCAPLLAGAAAIAAGCAGQGPRTVALTETRDPAADMKAFETVTTKFLTASDPAERARCVKDGEDLREELATYYAARPQPQAVRVEAAKLRDDRNAVVVAVMTVGGQERRVVLILTRRERTWLVDWKSTLALAK